MKLTLAILFSLVYLTGCKTTSRNDLPLINLAQCKERHGVWYYMPKKDKAPICYLPSKEELALSR